MRYKDCDPMLGRAGLKDDGCELYPVCLECPLPRCIEEERGGRLRRRLQLRRQHMVDMRRNGSGTRHIALAFGVSQRTVQRELRRAAQEDAGDD